MLRAVKDECNRAESFTLISGIVDACKSAGRYLGQASTVVPEDLVNQSQVMLKRSGIDQTKLVLDRF